MIEDMSNTGGNGMIDLRQRDFNEEREEMISEIVGLRRQRLVLTLALVLAIGGMMTGCASTDYLAVATACGTGPECDELWDDWNRHEDRLEAERAWKAASKQCSDTGGVLVTVQHGAKKGTACRSREDMIRQMEDLFGR